MMAASSKAQCFICHKDKIVYHCEGCLKDFCLSHITEHREKLRIELNEIKIDRDIFQQAIEQERHKPENFSLIERINQWEENSIEKIKQTAEQCRQMLIKYPNNQLLIIEQKFNQIIEQIKQFHQDNEFNEIDLNQLRNKLTHLTKQLIQPLNISIRHNILPAAFLNEISIISSAQIKWKQEGTTVIGNSGKGQQLNQLNCPNGIFIDTYKRIFIADRNNHRIIQWKSDGQEGECIAGGYEKGNEIFQLNYPSEILIDQENMSLIIADQGNRRIMRWSIKEKKNPEILLSNIDCSHLAMDKDGYIYISDYVNHVVTRWKENETERILVAGGNGKGGQLNQLNNPSFLYVDENNSIYISDRDNHRIVKWRKDAREGIIVAGGNGQGKNLNQLSSPQGIILNHLGQIYIADCDNHRIMCWYEGSREGAVVIGNNRSGKQSNQLDQPHGLSFDSEGDFYVGDYANHRIQKFEISFD
ncbi:unnamed protein product [Adineta ricciae]|uniref:Uncharacterized protein n=1 Tax=Adineta ricciae TaxID=249248 RepID=A0A815CY06_ADIRI|nr:unnamed protein product [Adineta ricciae]CAF1288915.1 unnamed protein product [Adineta ricciae]